MGLTKWLRRLIKYYNSRRGLTLLFFVTQNLQDRVAEIDGLLGLIENIVEETSLLALNASIEVARADEERKGFALFYYGKEWIKR